MIESDGQRQGPPLPIRMTDGIFGFEVTPRNPSSSIIFFSFPERMIRRSMKSIRMLWP
jgi:hypothetical protein